MAQQYLDNTDSLPFINLTDDEFEILSDQNLTEPNVDMDRLNQF
jgi:hypothetical protein